MQTTQQRSTVVGVFNDRRQAQQAVEELRRVGFREDQIGVVARNDDQNAVSATHDSGSKMAEGAVTGLVAGAGTGALWALGIAAGVLPVIGPVIAGGLLAAVLASAAGGAAVAGIVGALIGLGIPEEEAKYYEGEIHSGRTLVTVKADARYTEAFDILRRHGAYDMSTKDQAHKNLSATATTRQTATAVNVQSQPGYNATSTHTGSGKMELREEELHANKQNVHTGDVRVHKEVITEHKTIDVPVNREEVVIERRAVSGRASTGEIRPGEEIRIPVSEEQVTLNKQTVVKEEVNIGKRNVKETEHVGGTVRKEEVRIEKQGDVEVRGNTDPKSNR